MKRLSVILAVLSSMPAAGEPAAGQAFYNTSWPEASAAAAVGNPARWIVVADNEMPKLAVFSIERQSAQLHAPALAAAVSPAYAVDDLEAATVFPWDENGDGKPEAVMHVFAGSVSRSKNGKVKEDRDALFALQIDSAALAAGKAAGVFPASVEYNRSLRSQLRALGSEHPAETWGPVLRDSIFPSGANPAAANPALAAEAGLNIEGLTVSSDGRSLLLGLRSPLVAGKAMLIPLTNPVAALGLGGSAPQPAAVADPVLLDLGGLGFRSIEWDAGSSRYLISAGNAAGGAPFRLYTWSGKSGDAPQPVNTPGALQAVKIDPEGIAPIPGLKCAAVIGDGEQGAKYHEGRWVDFGAK